MWPIVEFNMWYFSRFLKRLADNPLYYIFCCSLCGKRYKYRTKTTSIPEYLEIYSGPVYFIHYKYSYLLNIVFMTFTFGAGLPLLYPIAWLSFLIFYIMERILLAYSYREPPFFDQTLNSAAIRILMFAPILYCAFGFWMFNNIQIFGNDV
jgi:hypothetical protein